MLDFGSQSFDHANDHYVAFLSNGVNPPSYREQLNKRSFRRVSKLGSLLAKLIAVVIGVAIIAGIYIAFHNGHLVADDPARLAGAVVGSLSAGLSSLFVNDGNVVQAFEEFIVEHGRVYVTLEEKQRRLQIFAKNLMYINLHNSQNFTYSLAANDFTDLTYDEFKAQHFTGYRKRVIPGELNRTEWTLLLSSDDSLPDEISWKDRGCVSAVRDQHNCGACWAFSAAGAVEGAYCAKYGNLLSLSSQQMVDCAGPEGNEGCDGGEMDDAFQYIIDHGGLCKEDSYPYIGEEGQCRDDLCTEVVNVVKFGDVPKKSEKALKAAVALKGPVSVAVQADQIPFQFYHEGVFDAACGTKLNHGVLVVGYGVDTLTGQDYWLVKNSWGRNWGDRGFMKLIRNDGSHSGKCGILLDASYPIVG